MARRPRAAGRGRPLSTHRGCAKQKAECSGVNLTGHRRQARHGAESDVDSPRGLREKERRMCRRHQPWRGELTPPPLRRAAQPRHSSPDTNEGALHQVRRDRARPTLPARAGYASWGNTTRFRVSSAQSPKGWRSSDRRAAALHGGPVRRRREDVAGGAPEVARGRPAVVSHVVS